jgi:hypothetical protein
LHDEREFIPKLQGWRYEIPEYFFASHSEDLAIEYAAYCLAKSPNDPMLLTNLSKFYRLSKQPEKSIELLIDNIPHHSNDRGSVTELGVSYKYNKQYYNSIAMLAYSISTERSYLSPTATDIKIAFGSIVECIAEMKDVYITEDFEKQYIAAITVAGNLRNLKRNDIQSAVHELNMWVNEILTTRISLEASNILGNLQILRLLE